MTHPILGLFLKLMPPYKEISLGQANQHCPFLQQHHSHEETNLRLSKIHVQYLRITGKSFTDKHQHFMLAGQKKFCAHVP